MKRVMMIVEVDVPEATDGAGVGKICNAVMHMLVNCSWWLPEDICLEVREHFSAPTKTNPSIQVIKVI